MIVPEEPWRKYAEELIRLATFLVGPSDAEDLVVSSYLRAVTSRQWGGVVNHRAFLFRALTNDAANHHRSIARRRTRETRALAGRDRTASDHSDAEARALIGHLSARQRTIAWMAYWLDDSSAEIAATLGISRRSVDRELNRIRTGIAKELQ